MSLTWGEAWGGEAPAYVTPDGELVWLFRKGQRVRFFDAEGTQVGPEHGNVAPAVVYAAAHAWVDPAQPLLSLACISEVRGQEHRS